MAEVPDGFPSNLSDDLLDEAIQEWIREYREIWPTSRLPDCAECGRSPRRGEVWSIYYADIGEAVTYCPECAEREFGGATSGSAN